MPRHMSDLSTSSEDEAVKPLRASKTKENQAPKGASGRAKQQATKRKPAKAGKSAATDKLSNNASNVKHDREQDSEDELGAAEDEGNVDDIVAETQFNVGPDAQEPRKQMKGTAKAASSQRKAPAGQENSDATPTERRLQAKLDLKSKALEELQEAFKQLSDIRNTRAEESERQLTEIAAERQNAAFNMVELYKRENDELRREVDDLRAGRSPEPSASRLATDSSRIKELESMLKALKAENAALQNGQRESNGERQKLRDHEEQWQSELAQAVKAKEGESARMVQSLQRELSKAKKDLEAAQQELKAEVDHSKTLMAKLKGTPAAVPSASSANASAEELEQVKQHLALNEDLTGLVVVSTKSEDSGEVYNCILNDCLGLTGGLNFKLVFHVDESVGYQPDVDAERDAALAKLLPVEFQKYMRFPAEHCAEWFRQLFLYINKAKP